MPAVRSNGVVDRRALIDRWLVSMLHAFDPFTGTSVAELSFRRKCLNELAVYLLWREHLEIAPDARTEQLKAAFANHASDDYIDLACRSPKRVLMFTAALAYALRADLLDPVRRTRVSALLAGAFAWNSEWPAFRQLDLLVATTFAGLPPRLSGRDVMAVSSVAVPPCPIYSDRDAFYALCHSIVYGFMLGTAATSSGDLVEAIDGGLCRAVASQDLDLGLELALAAMALGMDQTPAMTLVLAEMFARLDSPVVSLEPTTIAMSAIEEFVSVRPQERGFAESVHTAIVAALVLALMEARGASAGASYGEREFQFARGVGAAFQALHKYSLLAGVMRALELTPSSALESAHVRRIAGFVALNEQRDGRFGLFVEERALFASSNPDSDFDVSVGPHIDAVCRQFLVRHVAGTSGSALAGRPV
jgi:hypothetical protein